jgi:hypothetical protein
MRASHTVSLSIQRSFNEVYAFLVKPANFEQWAAVEPGTLKQLPNGDWQVQMSFGFRHVRFTPRNRFGVLDHAIFEPGGSLLFTPMRVFPNEDGCELSFTFFRRDGMDDAQFASSIEWITTDFLALKSLLEAGA